MDTPFTVIVPRAKESKRSHIFAFFFFCWKESIHQLTDISTFVQRTIIALTYDLMHTYRRQTYLCTVCVHDDVHDIDENKKKLKQIIDKQIVHFSFPVWAALEFRLIDATADFEKKNQTWMKLNRFALENLLNRQNHQWIIEECENAFSITIEILTFHFVTMCGRHWNKNGKYFLNLRFK